MALPNGWAQAILRGIGAPATPQNLRFLSAWQRAEGGGTANNANFNPLNTTQGAAGAGSINSVGVKSYRSSQQGLKATIQTLLNGHYGDIVQGLRSGKMSAQQLAHSHSLSTWGTGGGVLRVLGAGGDLSPASGGPAVDLASRTGGRQTGSGGPTEAFRGAVVNFLIDNSNALARGERINPDSILELALARQQMGQPSQPAQQLAAKVAGAPGTSNPVPSGHVKYEGNLLGLNQNFLNKLSSAAASVGATKIKITSGYRSPAHNRAVGGVPNSNHTTGHAMDGYGMVNGKWVPLGVLLRTAASRYGLRSGDQPGFYHGGVDTVHVDDGYNLRH